MPSYGVCSLPSHLSEASAVRWCASEKKQAGSQVPLLPSLPVFAHGRLLVARTLGSSPGIPRFREEEEHVGK